MSFFPLKDLLSSSLSRAGIQKEVSSTTVLETCQKVFQDFFGLELQSAIHPRHVNGEEIVIHVDGAVLAQEIRFREQKILQAIQKHHPRIFRLRLIV